jgi:APA family basic amino acid/polyamine antiporter
MVVSQVIGVGIFLTPATLMRTVGGIGPALGVWVVLGVLSLAGALCYAELTTRFPKAGGGYVFLREAFGARVAFVFGWMALLVTDPGITAALGIGLAQYLLATIGGSPSHTPVVAAAVVAGFCLLTLGGIRASGAFLRWAAVAKLTIVTILVLAGLRSAGGVGAFAAPAPMGDAGLGAYAPAVIAAFFAFGGWWELGRMSEEVESPRRTMPRALVGGLALVTVLYALITVAFTLSVGGPGGATDDAFVAAVGAALFGAAAARLLSAMVVAAVAGSLAATFLAAPRMYMAMSRDGLFPARVLRFDEARGTAAGATLIQTALACVLIGLGTFEQVLGYFVPATIFFLGLSAGAVLRLPRPVDDGRVFVAPWHPIPVLLFLLLIAAVLVLFVVGQPRETLIGFAVAGLGIPASLFFRGTKDTKDTKGTKDTRDTRRS